MRNKGFIAVHRGGLLTQEQHRLLIRWAYKCAEHVLALFGEKIDDRLNNALIVAKEWENGNVSVGDARKASLSAIAVANEYSNDTAIAVSRALGHAVATAHMADHALRAAEYALKAVKIAGDAIDIERKWQDEQIPSEIRGLVLLARNKYAIYKNSNEPNK